jgi:hypothetical protein
MDNCHPKPNPCFLDNYSICSEKHGKAVPLNKKEHTVYRNIIGSLLYLAITSRPDISFAVGCLSRQLHEPFNYHLTAAKHLLRYLAGTKTLRLQFGKTDSIHSAAPSFPELNEITIFTDSDYAHDKETRRSIGGFISLYHSHPISWQSKRQGLVSLSVTEAEFYALTEAVREAIYIQQWFKIYFQREIKVLIYGDNSGSLQQADHPTDHQRNKHVDVRHYWIREHVRNKTITIKWISTMDQLADILTKKMGNNKFNYLRNKIIDNTLLFGSKEKE